MTALGGRPKPELCFLPGRLRWTLLLKKRYGNSLSGCGSNTQPSNWEADTLPLSYCPIHKWWRDFIHCTGSRNNAPLIQSYIHEKYSQLLQIYTDWSKITTKTGCVISFEHNNKWIANAIHKLSSSVRSELYAILFVLYSLLILSFPKP